MIPMAKCNLGNELTWGRRQSGAKYGAPTGTETAARRNPTSAVRSSFHSGPSFAARERSLRLDYRHGMPSYRSAPPANQPVLPSADWT